MEHPRASSMDSLDDTMFKMARAPAVTVRYSINQTLADLISLEQAFENTSTNVAASQMRNALNKLVDTVKDPKEKQVTLPHNPEPGSH